MGTLIFRGEGRGDPLVIRSDGLPPRYMTNDVRTTGPPRKSDWRPSAAEEDSLKEGCRPLDEDNSGKCWGTINGVELSSWGSKRKQPSTEALGVMGMGLQYHPCLSQKYREAMRPEPPVDLIPHPPICGDPLFLIFSTGN